MPPANGMNCGNIGANKPENSQGPRRWRGPWLFYCAPKGSGGSSLG